MAYNSFADIIGLSSFV